METSLQGLEWAVRTKQVAGVCDGPGSSLRPVVASNSCQVVVGRVVRILQPNHNNCSASEADANGFLWPALLGLRKAGLGSSSRELGSPAGPVRGTWDLLPARPLPPPGADGGAPPVRGLDPVGSPGFQACTKGLLGPHLQGEKTLPLRS